MNGHRSGLASGGTEPGLQTVWPTGPATVPHAFARFPPRGAATVPRPSESAGAVRLPLRSRDLPLHALALAALAVAAACAAAAPGPAGSAPAAVAGPDTATTADPREAVLRYVAGLDLSGRDGVSGLSGLAAPAPDRLVAVSDFGDVWHARLILDATGALTGLGETATARLGGPPRRAGKAAAAAEALALLPDGRAAVAFERRHRLEIYPPGRNGLAAAPTTVGLPAGLDTLPGNAGIEALAALPDGRLLAIAEGTAGADATHPAFLGRADGGGWTALRYRAARGFSPSDAAALPNGDVLVLERWYLPLFGFRARLSVIPAAALADPGRGGERMLAGRFLAELAPPLGRDNLEGLAVAPGATGAAATLYLVSDDNRAAGQRPLLLQYRLTRGAAAARP